MNKCYAKVVNHPATKGIFSTLQFKAIFAALEGLYNNWFKMFSLLVSTGQSICTNLWKPTSPASLLPPYVLIYLPQLFWPLPIDFVWKYCFVWNLCLPLPWRSRTQKQVRKTRKERRYLCCFMVFPLLIILLLNETVVGGLNDISKPRT